MADREHAVITVNDTEYHAHPGDNLMTFMHQMGMELHGLCYHESLGPIATCDTCTVEVNGELKRACSTAIESGMKVNTKTPDAEQAQKIAMNRILVNHELYCTVCDYNNGACDVHNTVKAMGIEHQDQPFAFKPYEEDPSGSFYRYDPDQCIQCGRCVEACQNVEVNETLSIDWSLDQPRVMWDGGTSIDDSSCVNCGQCVTVCPCNALMEKSMVGEAGYMTGLEKGTMRSMIDLTKKVENGYGTLMSVSDSEAAMREERIEKTKTVCTYCGVGCSFDVWTKDRKILKVEPQPDSPANGISSCVKGKFGWDYVNSDERLTKPLVRKGDRFHEVEWEEALDVIKTNLSSIKQKDGSDAIGLISSSKATNEESYLMQKLGRQVIGTNNIDNCSRYCQAPATKGLFRTVGYGGDSGSMSDLEKADLVITIGSNTAESHPVLASKIRRAHKLNGQGLIVADIRKHEMAERADVFIQPKPGTDLVWLSAVTHYILEQGWEDAAFLSERVNGLDDYREHLEKYTLDQAEQITGLSKAMLTKVAETIHNAGSVSICWAMGVTQQKGGSDTSTAISNLLLVTGNYGRPGTGAYPLRGHNNVQGCSDFGSMPNTFPGYEPIDNDEVRKRYEQAWGTELPDEPGLDNHEMVEAIHDDQLKALYLQGEDMGIVDSNMNHVQAAYEKLDFFVVQELFLTKTAQYADVVLPAVPSLEKAGTFTNTERRIQRLYQVLEPLGDAKPDWQIIQLIANHLGADWRYHHPSAIMDEAASLANLFKGVSYDLLEGYQSLQWPVRADGTDEPLLYTKAFAFEDGKARLFPVDWTETTGTDDEYDLHVNNGRLLEHFHEGNMTYKSEGITRKTPKAFFEVSPDLAEDRGIKDGSVARLVSRHGAAKGHILVTDRVKDKEIYVPMNDNGEAAINRLTSSEVDKDTDTPAYKDTAVRMDVLEVEGARPMPDNNHRYGKRTPQQGVLVENKWARDDYVFPGEVIRKKKEMSRHGKTDNRY
nr:formate dehydrogenase subunit alpha [Tuberibacillus sp. Marseille-P3662]